MAIVPYEPDMFERLQAAVSAVAPDSPLCHRVFVDNYYAGNPWCVLYVNVEKDGSISGTVGVERMPFECKGRGLTFGFGSNFMSFKSGVGGLLLLRWMRECPYSIVFGGSPDVHKIIRSRGWTYFSGVRIMLLNREYPLLAGDPFWKRWIKRALAAHRKLRPMHRDRLRRRILRSERATLSVREEQAYASDSMPNASPFLVRFTPSAEYLAWRYGTKLPHARYRVFRILDGERPCGYVVLHERERRITVAHCDGDDPESLARGVLLSLCELQADRSRKPEILLASSHPAMQEVYRAVGFRPAREERQLAIGALKGDVAFPASSEWLVNFGWGDNALRPPFSRQ